MPEFELQRDMPALEHLNSIIDMMEIYYMKASGTSASNNRFCDAIYNAKQGDIGHILGSNSYTPEICRKASAFISANAPKVTQYLRDEAIAQWKELVQRLRAIAKAKEDTEDPLGW